MADRTYIGRASHGSVTARYLLVRVQTAENPDLYTGWRGNLDHAIRAYGDAREAGHGAADAAGSASADQLRAAAGRLLRLNKPGSGQVDDADAADTPLYDRQRLVTAADLLSSTTDSAVQSSAGGGERQP